MTLLLPAHRCGTARASLLRFASEESGSSIVETAMSILLMMTVSFWLIEFSMLVYTYSVLNQAAQDGIRYAIVHGSDSSLCSGPTTGCTDSTGANVINAVKNTAKLSLHNVAAINVAVSYPESTGCKPGSLVSVGIKYTYIPYVNLPGIGQSVNMTAQGRIVY